jgi:hypothetical protein
MPPTNPRSPTTNPPVYSVYGLAVEEEQEEETISGCIRPSLFPRDALPM